MALSSPSIWCGSACRWSTPKRRIRCSSDWGRDRSTHGILGESLPELVRQTVDDDETAAREIVAAAASVLAAAGVRPAEVVALGDVLVPTQSGDWTPAAQVVLPGSLLGRLVDEAARLDASLARESHDGWLALGVLGELTVVTISDVVLDPRVWDDLMVEGGEWCEDVADRLDAESPSDVLADSVPLVRGLEFIEAMDAERAWQMLRAPGVRPAVLEPASSSTRPDRRTPCRHRRPCGCRSCRCSTGGRPSVCACPTTSGWRRSFRKFQIQATRMPSCSIAMGVHTSLDRWLETTWGSRGAVHGDGRRGARRCHRRWCRSCMPRWLRLSRSATSSLMRPSRC